MKNRYFDLRLITGLIISHALMYFTFYDRVIFWYIFTGSLLILITYAMFQEAVDDEASFFKYLSLGTVSGLILYLVFWMGIQAFDVLNLPFEKSVNKLYRWFAPALFWQYLALILVAAPGEELFWRGFVQKRLLHYFGPLMSIFIGALLYASVHIYSGTLILMLAAFLSGLLWGALYLWKRSMPLVIVSHIVFDIMIFIILPLK
ncbi:CPBP family intramembrane glutamic endopeptidase [Bacillus sp. 7884-1]|uniref:CPBP family intramembrane glutamic endopeptidase n=1 Tax=Bacillus sp. 7884-1 TaxID=2021693 RepID=UPI000BA62734|nr:CPBP family intramembrane glutamic endopeptidase [Bacillus sp. 7884-1]PAE43181.1 CPBP family intramembrane metalloprotease [Bacillus sp. 7884-1]